MKFKVLIVLYIIVQLTIDQQNLAFNDKATNNVCVYISYCSTYTKEHKTLTKIVRLYHQLAQNEQENNRQHGDMNHSSLRQHQLSS